MEALYIYLPADKQKAEAIPVICKKSLYYIFWTSDQLYFIQLFDISISINKEKVDTGFKMLEC